MRNSKNVRNSVSEPFREKGHSWEAFSETRFGRTGGAEENKVLSDGKTRYVQQVLRDNVPQNKGGTTEAFRPLPGWGAFFGERVISIGFISSIHRF